MSIAVACESINLRLKESVIQELKNWCEAYKITEDEFVEALIYTFSSAQKDDHSA